jgi:hypothetical protein
MDVVINSQIQSPLVRTLARTKGKSQSFTHSIPDNVPPCSFTKIVLNSQNAGETATGRNYKIKIPQYGYLRDAILRYTFRENTIDPTVVKNVQELYDTSYFFLADVQVPGSYIGAAAPSAQVSGAGSYYAAQNLSWYNLQSSVVSQVQTDGTLQSSIDFKIMNDLKVLAPQFEKLLMPAPTPASGKSIVTDTAGGSVAGTIQTIGGATVATAAPYNGLSGCAISEAGGNLSAATIASMLTTNLSLKGTYPDQTSGSVTAGAAGPYTQALGLNGNPRLWSNLFRFYYNIYLLSKNGTGSVKSIASMIWNRLLLEADSTTETTIYTTRTAANYAGLRGQYGNGDITNTLGITWESSGSTVSYDPSGEFGTQVKVTLPKYATLRSIGGQTVWIPKVPDLIIDATGTVVGVNFVTMDMLHPSDQASSPASTYLMSLSDSDSATNFRKFQVYDNSDDLETYDWQTESQYYQGMAANVAQYIQLSTHNRPIQTIYPQESYIRLQRMSMAERARYLKMMEAQVTKSGVSGTGGKAGEKTIYFPLLLASTENPSYNFDTRFVEQLDIDVQTQQLANIFTASDAQRQVSAAGLFDFAKWIQNYRAAVFEIMWDHDPLATVPTTKGVFSVPPTTEKMLTNLALPGISADPTKDVYQSFKDYMAQTPKAWVLALRTNTTVPQDYIKVDCLAYYHNFHDRTAQAIRDANFKPNTPASLLQYNTYAESQRDLKISEINGTVPISLNITTNNLVFGTSFLIRRRALNPIITGKTDHYMNTLPVKEVTITASGQQLYHSDFDEAALTDVWDYDLATGKVGRKYNNSVLVQSRFDEVTGEAFWCYHLPYCFSSDMTYNSGSIAFQTLNNPVITIKVDMGKDSSKGFMVSGDDNDYTIQVFHNYWNMIRIDSNTGAITRSLDL